MSNSNFFLWSPKILAVLAVSESSALAKDVASAKCLKAFEVECQINFSRLHWWFIGGSLVVHDTNFSGSLVVPLVVSKLNQPWHCSAVSKKEVSRLNCERLPIDLGALFLRTCSMLKKKLAHRLSQIQLDFIEFIYIYCLYLRIYYWFILGIITIIVIVVQYHNIRYLQIKQPPPKKNTCTHTKIAFSNMYHFSHPCLKLAVLVPAKT